MLEIMVGSPFHHYPSSLNPYGVVHGGRRQGTRGMSPDTCPPGPWLGKVAGHLEEHLVEEERPRPALALETLQYLHAQGLLYACKNSFTHLA